MATVCGRAVPNSTKVSIQGKSYHIHVMDYASVEFFSVAYLGLYVALESVKLNKNCKQTHCVGTSLTAEIHSLHD